MSGGLLVDIEFDVSDIQRCVREADRHIDRGLRLSVEHCCEVIAKDARKNHSFQNRTHNLEDSIHPEKGLAGHLDADGEVIVGEDYASYVEAKMPFLQPAIDAAEPMFERELTEWIETAERILSQ